MPMLSRVSAARLQTCDPRLIAVVKAAILRMDFSVLCGHRDEAAQTDAFERGFSKLRWPNSKHNANPSKAVDLAPYPIDWANTGRFHVLVAVMKEEAQKLEVPLRCGADFNRDGIIGNDKFIDLPHFEIDE